MYYNYSDNYTGPTLNMQINNNTEQAVLMLFSRIYTPDFARRPMVYAFGGEFRRELSDRLANVGTLGGWQVSKGYFGKDACATSIVLPSPHADKVQMSVFSELWSFILIINTIKPSPSFTGMPSMVSREIFSGFVCDDPVSTSLIMGQNSDIVNYNALLVTTHHTCFNLSDNIISPMSIESDTDIIPQQQAANIQMDGTALTSLRPDKLVQGMVPVDNVFDAGMMYSPVPLNQNTDIAEEVDASYNIPTTHVTKMVDGLAKSIANTPFNNCLGVGDAMDKLTENLSAQLQPGYSCRLVFNQNRQMIRPDKPFTMGDLDLAFPGNSLHVQVCRQPAGQNVNLVDPMAPTIENQMTSLISSCLPVLLMEHGFTDIRLRYTTCDPNGHQAYKIEEDPPPGTLVQLTQAYYSQKIQNLMDDIINDIFAIIRANAGEFDVMIECSVGGVTLVDLNLLDWHSQHQNGFMLTNNRLGGLNSSLIGSSSVSEGNQKQLSNVLQDCVNVGMAGVNNQNYVY